MSEERRRAVRHPFVASAEVEDLAVGSRLPSRISDLSAGGCYVDTINPFADGTRVRVDVYKRQTLVYSILFADKEGNGNRGGFGGPRMGGGMGGGGMRCV